MRYYHKAADCRFYKIDKIHSVLLPAGCSWAYSPQFLLFIFEGKTYALGLSPEGIHLGFSVNPKPDELAQIALVKLNQSANTFVLHSNSVPEEHIEPLFRQLFPPVSGQWIP